MAASPTAAAATAKRGPASLAATLDCEAVVELLAPVPFVAFVGCGALLEWFGAVDVVMASFVPAVDVVMASFFPAVNVLVASLFPSPQTDQVGSDGNRLAEDANGGQALASWTTDEDHDAICAMKSEAGWARLVGTQSLSAAKALSAGGAVGVAWTRLRSLSEQSEDAPGA